MRSDNIIVISLLLLIVFSLMAISNDFNPSYASADSESAGSDPYDSTLRASSYTLDNRSISPYPSITMSAQYESQANSSLIDAEKEPLFFNLTTSVIDKSFSLQPNEPFLAIDGCSQSDVLRVNYTVYYPNSSIATGPVTTLASGTHIHFFMVNPPAGTWRVESRLIDEGETTAWLQAVSYNNGSKFVGSLEKEQLHLLAGQTLYYKIPLYTSDWFYLHVNRFAGQYIQVSLSKEGSYNIAYRSYQYYTNPIGELFLSSSSTPGTYLLTVVNQGSTDIFIEIVKASGVTLGLNVDSGRLVKSRFRFDLEFFRATIAQSYDWIAFDGAVVKSGMSARFLIIDPNLSIIYDGTSTDPTDFNEKMVVNNTVGAYYLGVFGSENANATIKITSSDSAELISTATLDQDWTFTQSGQTTYLKIPQSQKYFFLAGYQYGSYRGIKYTLFNPSLSSIWSTQPYSSQPYVLYPPTIPNVPYYILKLQGQADNSSMIHLRFQGHEDFNIETPDCTTYQSRFAGDIVVANVSVRNSPYVLQHIGAFQGASFVALFDGDYNQKLARSFSSPLQTYYQRWRQGFENPNAGSWLQIFIATDSTTSPSIVQVSTLQSGDETQKISTPYQFTETLEGNAWWKVETYEVTVDSSNWFGIVSQLSPVNSSYSNHPYSSIWVYDSSLDELQSERTVRYGSTFATSFWPTPQIGSWLIVLVGFQHSQSLDPLDCSVSLVGDADFNRDWPSNLVGDLLAFDVTFENTTYTVTTFSNSTISGLSFNPQNAEISMAASGLEGTDSFNVVAVPKQLAERPFAAYVDDEPATQVLSTENATHTFVYIPFEGGNHELSLVMTSKDVFPPVTSNNYDGSWHTSNFAINLVARDFNGVFQTYYRINDGSIQTISGNGQPLIVSEGGNNKLEYWSTDVFGNDELPHNTITNIKLDKTAPTGAMLINNGAEYTNSDAVGLVFNANDATSGLYQIRLSNNGAWNSVPWEAFSSTMNWDVTSGDGVKTVYCEIKDNAGWVTSFSDSIILDATKPVANAGQNRTVTQGENVTFDGTSSYDNFGIASYSWDFGDGGSGTGSNVTHAFNSVGNFTAVLTVQDVAGNSATSNANITVEASSSPTPGPSTTPSPTHSPTPTTPTPYQTPGPTQTHPTTPPSPELPTLLFYLAVIGMILAFVGVAAIMLKKK